MRRLLSWLDAKIIDWLVVQAQRCYEDGTVERINAQGWRRK